MSNSSGLVYGIFADFSAFPLWYHAVNVWYLTTNIYMMVMIIKLNKSLDVPDGFTWIAAFGLVGGLIEHMSPYIPVLSISVDQETVWFRIPTAAMFFATGISLLFCPSIKLRAKLGALSLLPIALYITNDFLEQETAASLNWHPFHSKHVWLPHLCAPIALNVLFGLTTLRIDERKNNERPEDKKMKKSQRIKGL